MPYELLYLAAHDLQEPLRTIRNYAGILAEHCECLEDEEVTDALAVVQSNVDWATRLIESLLQYSQIQELDRSWVKARQAVEGAIDNLRTAIEEKQARVDYNCSEVGQVWAHPIHLQRVFQNLISNALKYSDHPHIQVECSKTADGMAQFCIADNGVGIDPRYHELIFRPFKRLSPARINGTGVGLAECKRIVELYGGRIWVDSAPGQGAKFYFTVPYEHITD